jgi:cellulose synthase/poly-beta-1,6-N-acetylglucosamine synthase-like glycosyltransferase
MDLYAILYWTVIGCFVYLLSVYTMFGLLLVVSAAENVRLARQDRNEDYETLAESRFTIPVSLIAPAFNEEVVIAAAVRSLVALDYPCEGHRRQ